MELPAVNIKAIVFMHWLLTIFACMFEWLPSAYTLANHTVLAMGVWAIAQKDSVDAIFLFFIGLLSTVLTDILLFAMYFAVNEQRTEKTLFADLFRFSAGMAILSLLLKPLSCFFIYHMYRERGGEYNISLGFITVARDRSTYQSIDHTDSPAEQENKSQPRAY
ncbi:type-1 angiotensin II receptor-associated protein [Rhinophrynus dorsalis]